MYSQGTYIVPCFFYPTIYVNEWILWQAGVTDNVRNFKYKIKEVPGGIKLYLFQNAQRATRYCVQDGNAQVNFLPPTMEVILLQ